MNEGNIMRPQFQHPLVLKIGSNPYHSLQDIILLLIYCLCGKGVSLWGLQLAFSWLTSQIKESMWGFCK